MTDFVVTYVCPDDYAWRKEYERQALAVNCTPNFNSGRYRDFGTIRYVLRGVATYMPWVRNCYLVVERESQVPAWVNRKEVKIIYHKQIIPSDYLPTYNSCTIECFLWKIPGLAEQFVYANDDMIPIAYIPEKQFYNPLPCLPVNVLTFNEGQGSYRHQLHNGEALIRRILDMPPNNDSVMKTGHNINPHLKSTWELIWQHESKALFESLSTFRTKRNVNQNLCDYYHILSGKVSPCHRKSTYFEMKDIKDLCEKIRKSDSQLICVNDKGSGNFIHDKINLIAALNYRLPEKCKYEL